MGHPISWLWVLAGAALYLIIGGLWYSPLLFVHPWLRMNDKTLKEIQDTTWTLRPNVARVTSILLSFALARLVLLTDAHSAWEGARLGALLWLGFVVPTGTHALFELKPWPLFWINQGYFAVGMIAVGALHGATAGQ